jgi:hypothetical protein
MNQSKGCKTECKTGFARSVLRGDPISALTSATAMGQKKLKKKLHNCQTRHYTSAHEYGTSLYFTRRARRSGVGKLAAESSGCR